MIEKPIPLSEFLGAVMPRFPRAEDGPALIPLDALMIYCGGAYIETWYEGEDGQPDYKEIDRVGVCNGHLIHPDGDCTSFNYVRKQYNKKRGLRLWRGLPTEKQREATPWDG